MGQLSGFRYRELIQRLRKLGFELLRQASGSHEIWHNPTTGRFTTIPKHSGDMPEGTVKSILKQANISTEEFLNK
ncbi:MAG: type II toxin-antitoxin system HicA family toxin [Candidatus Kapabacteria bacterium]|jgi:predicted RNA binding protein YcfA (HicA-like mRNA interferase family)|nr:type II toxin-antitoxin system HicA family toxin [Candidatus Kapabacteria bacterium]